GQYQSAIEKHLSRARPRERSGARPRARTLRGCTSVVIVKPIRGSGRIYDASSGHCAQRPKEGGWIGQPPGKIMPKAQTQAKEATPEHRPSRPVGIRLLHVVDAYLRKKQRG